MSYKIFLDDARYPIDVWYYTGNIAYYEEDWIIVRHYIEFVNLIKNQYENNKQLPLLISFDHDLAIEHYEINDWNKIIPPIAIYDNLKEKTGYDAAKWLVQFYIEKNIKKLPEILIHTMNSVGKKNIEEAIKDFERYHNLKNRR